MSWIGCGDLAARSVALSSGTHSTGKVSRSQRVQRGGFADDDGDGLAALAGAGLGQRRLVGEGGDDAEAVVAGDVGGGEDVDLAGGFSGPGGSVADGEGGGMVRRADRAHFKRVGSGVVGAVDFGAHDLGQPVEAFDTGADGVAGLGARRGPIGDGGVANRVDDLGIAGAAAEHAAERVFGLGPGWLRIVPQQGGGGHQHARRADAALRRPVAQEGGLQVGLGVGPQPLDGGDLGLAARAAVVRQAQTGAPFSRTVQAPQSPASQPTLVPRRPRSSRSTSRRRRPGRLATLAG